MQKPSHAYGTVHVVITAKEQNRRGDKKNNSLKIFKRVYVSFDQWADVNYSALYGNLLIS